MDSSKNYIYAEHADAAIILLLGSGGSNALTKAAAKWLVKQGVNALSLGPVNGAVGYHSFPLEHVEDAIQALKRCGNHKIGILGASITTIPALTAAALFPDIVLTMAVAPCDYVLQGFTQGKRDGCREWPIESESMLTWQDRVLPYVSYAYQHLDYWHVVQEETKGSGNMLAAKKIFNDSESQTPLKEDVMIPIENIHGRLLLIGCKDGCLWPTARYIRRMDERLKSRGHACKYNAIVYEFGTHYAFPESMLKRILPAFPDFFISRTFRSAREHPKKCKATREDIDRRMKQAIQEFVKEKS